jgi:hypothetical protein
MENGRRTSSKGNISESKVLAAYSEAGFLVALPFGSGAPYDVMVDLGHRVLKIQVKTGRLRNGCVLFPTQRLVGHRGIQRRKYRPDEFDLFAVYCPDNKEIYVLPLLSELTEGRLRTCETRNKQKQHVRWAEEFSFENHLRELRKEMELVGLEPTASAMPLQRSPS